MRFSSSEVLPIVSMGLFSLKDPLLKFQVIIDGKTMGEFKSGDMTKVNANADMMDMEVAVKNVVGWKRTLKLILRPRPPGNPEIDIIHAGLFSYPTATARNVEILEQKNC